MQIADYNTLIEPKIVRCAMNKRRVFTIPNLLSLLRLLMVPLFVWTYTVRQDGLLTALVLALSGLTDILDGQIARRYGMVSDVGKILDPIADKVTQGAMMICLLTRFPAMWVPLILLIVKEAFVGITNLMLIRETRRVDGAEMHGKVTTCFLYGMMLIHLLWGGIPNGLSIALIVITTLVMLMSFWLYGMRNIARLKRVRTRKI